MDDVAPQDLYISCHGILPFPFLLIAVEKENRRPSAGQRPAWNTHSGTGWRPRRNFRAIPAKLYELYSFAYYSIPDPGGPGKAFFAPGVEISLKSCILLPENEGGTPL